SQIPNIYYLLSKYRREGILDILWLYKKPIIESKTKKKGKKTDILESFFETVDISRVYYEESDRVLGNTYGMLVIEDFEGMTPNILAQSIETVKGGGIIAILLKKNMESYEMDIYNKYGNKDEIIPRFNTRLYKSLINSKFTIVLNDSLDVLSYNPNKKEKSMKIDNPSNIIGNNGGIVNIGINDEQRNIIKEFIEIINTRSDDKRIISLTAARGRGKSAVMGLIVANAIDLNYSTIRIASPRIENVRTLFNFIKKGLLFLGYEEKKDFEIEYILSQRNINKIIVKRKYKQTIEYLDPSVDMKINPDLLIIDEAAAIPLVNLKKLLTANLIFMASTINGYEGTGRVLTTKLFNELRKKSKSNEPFVFEEMKLEEPIRYSTNDPVEKWLNKILILDGTPKNINACPPPGDCELFCVNRDILFSYHSHSENFLKDLISLFVASHYKNSPNDIQLMADAPNHAVFVLLTPVYDEERQMPEILCAIQIAFEGKNRNRNGNIIPWILAEKCLKKEFLDKVGVRIVRIAVHPDYLSMGYGTKALELLEKLFKNGMSNSDNNNNLSCK
ncbi:RNA cytidine acetyltransferase, partial [Astathelohania contejeani]